MLCQFLNLYLLVKIYFISVYAIKIVYILYIISETVEIDDLVYNIAYILSK